MSYTLQGVRPRNRRGEFFLVNNFAFRELLRLTEQAGCGLNLLDKPGTDVSRILADNARASAQALRAALGKVVLASWPDTCGRRSALFVGPNPTPDAIFESVTRGEFRGRKKLNRSQREGFRLQHPLPKAQRKWLMESIDFLENCGGCHVI